MLDRLGYAIPLDESGNIDFTGVQSIDSVFESPENGFR
jgi:hypothetical protein